MALLCVSDDTLSRLYSLLEGAGLCGGGEIL